jgi:stearoyl-CoA desaturase (delta-9 desaturase)
MTLEFVAMWLFLVIYTNLKWWYIHRSLSHRQFTMHPSLVVLAKLVVWTSQPKYYSDWVRTWVAVHVEHHKHSDTERDLHSPYFSSLRDMIASRRRWLTAEEIENNTRGFQGLDPTRLDRWLERWPIGQWVLLALCLVLFQWWGILLWAACRGLKVWHGVFNWITHRAPGWNNSDRRPSSDRARNVPLVGLLYAGEHLHGNHHRWPHRSNFGVRWWEFDFSYWLLRALSLVGLVKFERLPRPIQNIQLRYVPPS